MNQVLNTTITLKHINTKYKITGLQDSSNECMTLEEVWLYEFRRRKCSSWNKNTPWRKLKKKKSLTSLYQSKFQVKYVLRALRSIRIWSWWKADKNKQWLASDLFLSLSFLLKGKSHMSLGENSNFSLMLLVWEEKWILRHHVPKFWKCHVDLKYMVCICKCCHMDIASHLSTSKKEHFIPPRTTVWREKVIWHKVAKSESTEDLKEFSFPYLLGLNNLDSLKHFNDWWTR